MPIRPNRLAHVCDGVWTSQCADGQPLARECARHRPLCARSGLSGSDGIVQLRDVIPTEGPTMPYSLEDLKRKLADDGWRTNTGSSAFPVQGTLGEMVEGAHGRRKSGQAVGVVEEIETEIKIDMLQLEELWWHMGLPTI